MNRLSRLIGIIIYLEAHPGSKIEALTRRFKISERTVYRDINELRGPEAYVPIVYDNGYRIDPNFFLRPAKLDFGETCALFLAGSRLGLRREIMFHKEYLSAIDKIKANLDSQTRSTLERLEETTYLNIPESNKIKDAMSSQDFSILNEAIQEKKMLLISYFNRVLNKAETIMIDPYGVLYGVLIFRTGWYILAFCHKTKKIRVFNFIHIKKMTPLANSRFELPQNFSVKKYTSEVLNEAEKFYRKGIDLVGQDEDVEAVPFFKKAISLYPAYGDAHFSLALSYRMLDYEDKEVLGQFKKALENNCTDPELVYYQLSDYFSSIGKKDKAVEACKNAIKLRPEYTGYHIYLAEIYTNMGKYNEAINEYQRVIKLKPEPEEEKEVYQELTNCYRKIGNIDKANECLDILHDLSLDED